MEATATAKYVRHGALKLRQVANMLRGKSVDGAFESLGLLKDTKKSAEIIEGVLKSAVANFQDRGNAGTGTESLAIKSIHVDQGPHIKRIRPRAQGRAFRIQKKLSHVTVVVTD